MLNPVQVIAHEIDNLLTPEDRNYRWKLSHNLVSTKKSESKFKRDEIGQLVSLKCAVCKASNETKDYLRNICPSMI